VAPEHVRERISRLEMATRFRPLHMQTLLLADAPPAALADFFYFAEGTRAETGRENLFFHSVLRAAGIETAGKKAAACLAEFQRHAFYLAYVRECPGAGGADSAALAQTLQMRIRFSFKPKHMVALDNASQQLTHGFALEALGIAQPAGFSLPSALPAGEHPDQWAVFAEALRLYLQRIAK